MRCSKAQRLIDDYIDNLLDGTQTEELKQHLEACPECRLLYSEVGSIVGQAKEMETVSPSRDLWNSIERSLSLIKSKEIQVREEVKQPFILFRLQPGLATAAVVILAIVLLTFLFYNRTPIPQSNNSTPETTALNYFAEAEQQYLVAINSMDNEISLQNENIDPKLIEVFNENLKIIDQSIMDCKAAINEYPENQENVEYLMICYQKKIDLLNEIRKISEMNLT